MHGIQQVPALIGSAVHTGTRSHSVWSEVDAKGSRCAIRFEKIVVTSFLYQYWENCRWVDPSDDRDFEKMNAELQRAHATYPKLRGCTVERLCEALSIACDMQSEASDIGDGSFPMSTVRRERVAGGMGVVDPGIGAFKVQDGNYKHFVQVLIRYKYGCEKYELEVGSIYPNLKLFLHLKNVAQLG